MKSATLLSALMLIVAFSARDSNAQIHSSPTGGPWNEQATWVGNTIPTATDDVIIVSGSSVEGVHRGECLSLTVQDGATFHLSGNIKTFVFGPITNNGLILGTSGTIEAHSDVRNDGIWESDLHLGGDSRRTVLAGGMAGDVGVVGDVWLDGRNVMSKLKYIFDSPPGHLAIAPGASLTLEDTPEPGYTPAKIGFPDKSQFTNLGTVIVANDPSVSNGIVIGSDMTGGYFTDIPSDTLWVESHAFHSHPRFASSAPAWWRLRWSSTPNPPDLAVLGFIIELAQMGGFPAEELFLFHSLDEGETWQKLPDLGYVKIYDPLSETLGVTVFSAVAIGDYVLSIDVPAVSSRAALSIWISGRTKIRVGGPTAPYRIVYSNPSDQPTDRTIIGILTEGGVYIDKVIPSSSNDTGPEADGWEVDLFSPAGDSTEALIMTSPLGPRESRVLTVYLSAVPVAGKAALPAVAAAIVTGIALGYAIDLTANSVEEFMADPCGDKGDIQDKFANAFEKTEDQWNPFGNSESPWLGVAENGASGLATSGLIKSGFNKVTVINAVNAGASAVANGTSRYEDNTGRSIYEPIDCGPRIRPPLRDNKKLELDPVSSFDPNEKVGPPGIGENNFISSVGRMNFEIYFENKESATAPAYRIAITDTLSNLFDPNTVRIGESSHDGWSVSRVGNVITWEIEGIELPPNVTPPEGEGYVSFSVDPHFGLQSGDRLENLATIWFDLNDPITTNTYVNQLDSRAPLTVMNPLPAQSPNNNVVLSWSSDDQVDGSGVQSVVVYASQDGGPYVASAYTEGNTVSLDLEPDHDYSFFALAADRVGNLEVVRPDVVGTHTIVATEGPDLLPISLELNQNYPNPFRGETTFRFNLPTNERVELTVYDLLGRRVAELINGQITVGYHEFVWSTESLASGLYFGRLKQGKKSKMVSIIKIR